PRARVPGVASAIVQAASCRFPLAPQTVGGNHWASGVARSPERGGTGNSSAASPRCPRSLAYASGYQPRRFESGSPTGTRGGVGVPCLFRRIARGYLAGVPLADHCQRGGDLSGGVAGLQDRFPEDIGPQYTGERHDRRPRFIEQVDVGGRIKLLAGFLP